MKELKEKIVEALVSALPVTAIVYVLALTPLFSFSTAELITFTVGAVFLILGIGLFNLGADLSVEKIITALIPDAVFGLRYSLNYYGSKRRKTYDVFVPENTQLDDLPEIVKELNINYFYSPQSKDYNHAGRMINKREQYFFYNYERTICDVFSRYKEVPLTERWYQDIAREYVKKYKEAPDYGKRLKSIQKYSERLNLSEKVKDELDKYIFKEIKRKRNRSSYTCKRKPEEWL